MRPLSAPDMPGWLYWWLMVLLACAVIGLIVLAIGGLLATAHWRAGHAGHAGHDGADVFLPWLLWAIAAMLLPFLPVIAVGAGLWFGCAEIMAREIRRMERPNA